MAANATLHCITGCAIGEITGLMVGTALGLSSGATIVLAVGLAFLFGYALSTLPLIKAGLGFFAALSVVFAADTLSIATMEVVDNLVMAAIPGVIVRRPRRKVHFLGAPTRSRLGRTHVRTWASRPLETRHCTRVGTPTCTRSRFCRSARTSQIHRSGLFKPSIAHQRFRRPEAVFRLGGRLSCFSTCDQAVASRSPTPTRWPGRSHTCVGLAEPPECLEQHARPGGVPSVGTLVMGLVVTCLGLLGWFVGLCGASSRPWGSRPAWCWCWPWSTRRNA